MADRGCRRGIRFFATALAATAVAIVPTPGSAQVAVAPLAPIAPIVNGNPGQISAGFVLLNPAAQQWGAPSRVGAGLMQGETDVTDQGTYDYDGRLAGLRLVGMRWGASAETLSVEGTHSDTLTDFTLDQTNLGLSMRLMQPLAIGAAYGSQEWDSGAFSSTLTTTTLGGSLRIGEIIYLGIAGGEDTLEYDDSSTDTGFTADRNYYLYGVGLRRGGPFSFHVEWFGSDREGYNLEKDEFADLKSGTTVLEVGFWGFVLGARIANVDEENNGNRYKTTANIYDVAWAPFRGLTFGFRYEVTKEKDNASDTEAENEIRAVTVGWQF